EGSIKSIAFSADGARLFSLGPAYDGIRVWNLERQAIEATLRFDAPVWSFALSRNGFYMAVDTEKNGTIIGRLNDSPLRFVRTTRQRELSYSIALNSDGSLLSMGGKSSVSIWDARTPEMEPAVRMGPEPLVKSLAFSPDGKWLAAGSGYAKDN